MYPTSYDWKGLLWVLACSPALLSALPPLNPPATGSLFAEDQLAGFNLSSQTSNYTVGDSLATCDATRAGSGLSRVSCEEAFNKLPTSDSLLVFARKDSPTAHNVQVPRRYSSRK